MVDRDKIEGLLRHLQQYTAYVQVITAQDRQQFLQDPRSIGSTRYYLQVAIESCINIANHIIMAGQTAPLIAVSTSLDSGEPTVRTGLNVVCQITGLRL